MAVWDPEKKCSGTFSYYFVNFLDFHMTHADNDLMIVQEKTIRGHTYLYLVESLREGGRVPV